MGKKQQAGWFSRGKEGIEKSKRFDEENKARRESQGPRRFWLENESSAKVTFLDNPDFFVHEHNLKLGGRFHNYFTCIREVDTCPICESGDNASFVLVATVINHKKFKGKDEKVYKDQKQLIVFKSKAKEKILHRLEKRGSLKFTVWELRRGSSSTECNTGEDFEYLGKWGDDTYKPDKLKSMVPEKSTPKEWLTPFNYEEIFAPKSADELRKIVGGAAPVGGADDDDLPKGASKDEDADPFFDDDDPKESKSSDDGGDKDPLDDDDEKPKDTKKGGSGKKGSGKKGKSDDDTSIEDLI